MYYNMGTEEAVERSSSTVSAIMYVSIFLAVMLLAVVVVIGALEIANTDANGNSSVTGSNSNETLSALDNVTAQSFTIFVSQPTSVCTLGTVTNATDGVVITSGNYTQPTTCSILLTDGSGFIGNDINVTYDYEYETSSTAVDVGLGGIRDDVVSMVANFFALAPTIGTILAVIILIATIVILVLYVSRMRNKEESSTYAG